MKVFSNYAQYYDLLNQGKDYKEEVQYIKSILNNHPTPTKYILDLGCGTGLHAIHFAKEGYRIHGIDQSAEMISIAIKRLNEYPHLKKSIEFSIGDIRTFDIKKSFDSVIALFHVMSYQATNEDIQKTLNTVAGHLCKGGLFIFDCWYGPAVLSDKPYERTKTFEDSNLFVKRTAKPFMHVSKNCVDVNFSIFIKDKISGEKLYFIENHKMRYLFEPEMELMLNKYGFELQKTEEWLTGNKPDYNSWYVTFICTKK